MKDLRFIRFWKRVDDLLYIRRKSLTDLCNDCEIAYSAVNSQRTRGAIPKSEQLYDMAQYLGVPMEFLLTGESNQALPEKLRAVVDYLREHEDKLEAVFTMCDIKRGGCSSRGAQ